METKLLKYAEKGYSVLLSGLHGVGKTVLTEKTFEKMGWKYKTFNSATLNPYTDVTGVPLEGKTINTMTGKEVDCLIKRLPEIFAADDLDAIFFDEISRASKETMNGLFQLLQFKSINGYKLNRLKVIWGAYNPYNPELDEEDQSYHVNQLDPAFEDRFRIHLALPYELNETYLKTKHQSIAEPFINWWQELPLELKLKCSPRRLEESIITYKDGFDLKDVLYHDELQSVLPNLKERIYLANSSNQVKFFIESLAEQSIENAALKINIENVELVIDAIKAKELKPIYLKSINQDLLANIIARGVDTKLEKAIDLLKNKDKSFTLSPLAEKILFNRRVVLDTAIQEAFVGNSIKNNVNNEAILVQFSNLFFQLLLNYKMNCVKNNITKIDFNLEVIYDKLKSLESFKDFYKAAVITWHSWKSENNLLEKQNNLVADCKNELYAILIGHFIKMAVLDKNYKVFKTDVCSDFEQFKEVVQKQSENLLGKRKWLHFGMVEDNKTISKMVYGFFEGNSTILDVNVAINNYKW